MRQTASDIGISYRSVGRIVKNEQTYRFRRCHMLTVEMRNMRKLHQDTCLRRCLQEREQTIADANSKGSLIGKTAHPNSIKVWAAITSTGKKPPVFADSDVKINKNIYRMS